MNKVFSVSLLILLLLPALVQAGEENTNVLLDFIIAWFPLILIIGAFVIYISVMGASIHKKHAIKHMEHMDKTEALLERIASSIEHIENKEK